ncbi:MAG: LysR family transcriptional regulator [Sphingomonadales bacterium]|nr:MAG: LysR family transcriptional regulator [Sphingomonadales bacterium]
MGIKKSEMQFSSLQVAWLIAFVESADYKRTAAAGALGVNQSTVTKYIAKLESWYGGGPRRLLMLHNMHPPVLTAEGKEFLPVARQLLEHLRAAQPKPLKLSSPSAEGFTGEHPDPGARTECAAPVPGK